MGSKGTERIRRQYDWTVILKRYSELADELGEIRRKSGKQCSQRWPNRPDPFSLFSHYGTETCSSDMVVTVSGTNRKAVDELLGLSMLNYGMHAVLLPAEEIVTLYEIASKRSMTVGELLQAAGGSTPVRFRALLWLCKAGLVVFDGFAS